jgi:hypothetical protein
MSPELQAMSHMWVAPVSEQALTPVFCPNPTLDRPVPRIWKCAEADGVLSSVPSSATGDSRRGRLRDACAPPATARVRSRSIVSRHAHARKLVPCPRSGTDCRGLASPRWCSPGSPLRSATDRGQSLKSKETLIHPSTSLCEVGCVVQSYPSAAGGTQAAPLRRVPYTG